jgi:site-specific recombinase XerD
MKLSFWLRKAKARATGEAPLYAKITMEHQSPAQFQTGLWIRPEQWKPGGLGHVIGRNQLCDVYNETLIDIRAEINRIYNDLRRRGKAISPTVIKGMYTGELSEQATLQKAMSSYIFLRQQEPGLSESTISNFGRQMKNVLIYLVHSKQTNILCSDVKIKFLKNLDNFLRNDRRHSQVYTNRMIGFVKTVMDYAVFCEWIEYNPLHSYKYRRPERKKKIYLTQDELNRLIDFEFESWRMAQVRDLFVFQCFTGLAYAELMRFERSWLGLGVDGRQWIFTDRQKVHGSNCEIPLFDTARRLLEQWQYSIPQLDNQQYNRALKQVAFMCGIDKHLTSHVGRKTFGNILQENGVSIESISGMYGHADTRMTRSYYVDVSAVKVASETEAIRGI